MRDAYDLLLRGCFSVSFHRSHNRLPHRHCACFSYVLQCWICGRNCCKLYTQPCLQKFMFTFCQDISFNLRISSSPGQVFCTTDSELSFTNNTMKFQSKHLYQSLSLINMVRATHMIFQSLAVFQGAPTNLTVDCLITAVLVSHVSPNVLFGIKVVTHCTFYLGCNK